MLVKPFANRIQVKPLKRDFILSDSNEQIGEVIAIGAKVESIKVGDFVVFTPWGLDPFKNPDGETTYLIPESYEFILATVEM